MVKCSNATEWHNCLGLHGEWMNLTEMLKFYGGRCSVSYWGVFEVVESITATEGRKRGLDCPAPIVVEMSKTVLMLRQWDVWKTWMVPVFGSLLLSNKRPHNQMEETWITQSSFSKSLIHQVVWKTRRGTYEDDIKMCSMYSMFIFPCLINLCI